MKKPKFRYYPLNKTWERFKKESIKEKTYVQVSNVEVEKILPKVYWRKGKFFFKENNILVNKIKNHTKLIGVFNCLLYDGDWYKTETFEPKENGLDFPFPEKKLQESLNSTPAKYLNTLGKQLKKYWLKYEQKQKIKRETKKYIL